MLNERQSQAAAFHHGAAVVIAVPGSGKTLTMTQRIVNLVQEHQVPPETILGLTFTRNAAASMKSRLKPLLKRQASRVLLTTIHSFCHYLLRREGRVFEILHPHRQIGLMRDAIAKTPVKEISPASALGEISLAKSNGVDLHEFRLLYDGDAVMEQLAVVYSAYEAEKARRRVLDFDDLLLEARAILSNKEETRQKYRGHYRHLLVDEFQDVNPAQMEVLRLLADAENQASSFWVCGDDWQSIYAWMGASVANILHFERSYPQAQRFILNLNYRSTPQILAACQRLIEHNQRRSDKVLETCNPDGEAVRVLRSENEEHEAQLIADEVEDLVQRKGWKHSEVAVLYRCNFQSRTLEERFTTRRIPYQIEDGLNFYTRREIRILLDYLRFLHNPHGGEGDEALKRIINLPNRFVSRSFLADLESFAQEENLSLFQAIQVYPIEPAFLQRSLYSFVHLLEPLLEMGEVLTPVERIQRLREDLDYDAFIQEDETPSPDDQQLANLQQLERAASKFNDLNSFLEHADAFSGESKLKQPEGVRFMSIHKSKGLEFPVVFLTGLVEGLLPSKKGDLEEERRICFVGASRAMSLLYLSHSLYYLGVPAKPSPFLAELIGQ